MVGRGFVGCRGIRGVRAVTGLVRARAIPFPPGTIRGWRAVVAVVAAISAGSRGWGWRGFRVESKYVGNEVSVVKCVVKVPIHVRR